MYNIVSILTLNFFNFTIFLSEENLESQSDVMIKQNPGLQCKPNWNKCEYNKECCSNRCVRNRGWWKHCFPENNLSGENLEAQRDVMIKQNPGLQCKPNWKECEYNKECCSNRCVRNRGGWKDCFPEINKSESQMDVDKNQESSLQCKEAAEICTEDDECCSGRCFYSRLSRKWKCT